MLGRLVVSHLFSASLSSLGNKHSGACSACHSEWRAAGLRASLWRSRPAAEQRSPTRASGASNPEPGGLVDLKDLEGPRSCRTAGRSSSRRLRCCRKVAPPLLHDRPLRLRPDGAPPAAATMTAAAAPAVGKKDLACCRREPTARAEEHSPEAACVTCSCRSRRRATSYGK